jgi:hypothetical protein
LVIALLGGGLVACEESEVKDLAKQICVPSSIGGIGDDDQPPESHASVSVIFSCGAGISDCEHGTYEGYDGKVFGDIITWATCNDYEKAFFETATIEEKAATASKIKTKICDIVDENADTKVLLVGHSAGADSAIWAVYEYLFIDGGSSSNIRGIALLDSYLRVERDILLEADKVDQMIETRIWGGQSQQGINEENDFPTRLKDELGQEVWTDSHLELAVHRGAQRDIISFFEKYLGE